MIDMNKDSTPGIANVRMRTCSISCEECTGRFTCQYSRWYDIYAIERTAVHATDHTVCPQEAVA